MHCLLPKKRIMLTYTQRKNHTEDRISNLPDGILTYILSFLTTKESVRTSILPKRWKSVWTSVPTLYLRDCDFRFEADGFDRDTTVKIEDRYLKYVDRLFMSPIMPFLDKVVLKGNVDPSCHVGSWICAAVERNVRELHLKFRRYSEPVTMFPESLFSCNTLVVLKLCLEDMVLVFPMTSTCFPNLRVLEINSVIYKDDNDAYLLFSSCPVLEDLVIVRHGDDNVVTLNITSQSLKKLRVQFIARTEFHPARKLVIDAPSLESIDIADDVTEYYVMGNLPSIIKAKFDVSTWLSVVERPALDKMRIFKLFERISNVTFLSLPYTTMVSLSGSNSCDLSTFYNLTHLEFTCDEFNTWSWELVMEFLKNSPVLKALIFDGFIFSDNDNWTWSFAPAPKCLFSRLKTIEIRRFSRESEMRRVWYLLDKAKGLEKLTVELTVRKQLLDCARRHGTCQIEIL